MSITPFLTVSSGRFHIDTVSIYLYVNDISIRVNVTSVSRSLRTALHPEADDVEDTDHRTPDATKPTVSGGLRGGENVSG